MHKFEDFESHEHPGGSSRQLYGKASTCYQQVEVVDSDSRRQTVTRAGK